MLAIQEIETIKRDQLPPLLVVYGDDPGQYEIVKTELLKAIDYDPADLNTVYYDMRETAYAQVDLDLQSLPFFADEKLLILDYFEDLTSSRKKYLTDQDIEEFERYLESPSTSNQLILFCPGKLDGKRRIVKRIKKEGRLIEASQPKEADLRHYLLDQAQKEGLIFSSEVFENFLLQSAYQFAASSQNLALLKAYKQAGEISLEDIKEALPKTLQDNIFELSQMILKGKIDAARNLVKDLTLQGEDEVKLLAVLTSQFRTFLQVKLLWDRGLSQDAIAQQLEGIWGRKVNPYQIKFSLRDAQNLSTSYLKEAVKEMIERDFLIKSGQMDKALALDLLLIQLLSKKTKA